MLTTILWLEGEDFKVKSCVKYLGTERSHYKMKNDVIKFGKRKGEKYGTNVLSEVLSTKEDFQKHMKEVERKLFNYYPVVEHWRGMCKKPFFAWLSIGTTVGHEKYFTRTLIVEPKLMKLLSAHEISVQFCSYPASDEVLRKSSIWLEGIGITPTR